ncbi:MAG: hypothetical protein IT304_10810 [Dehalococcoidia bacterium]|nr:hypothetical protein [Dehalococcoidia bacterium]
MLDQVIANTKMAAALAYADELAGRGTRDRVEGIEQWVRALTGEPAREVVPSTPGVLVAGRSGQGAAAQPRRSVLQEKYIPFAQVTPFYCGPATAMSSLAFLGPRTSHTVNPDTGVREKLTGDSVHDQQLLAADFWLATDANGGTNWGAGYMPFTLNSWRGTRWYVAAGTPNVEGTLTREQALAAIKYDTDRGYPVAENVLYDASTYYPAGFLPGVTYQHWDTVYGHYQHDGREVVQVGQVYHDSTLPAAPYQDIDWDIHWTAIEQWHGIVW